MWVRVELMTAPWRLTVDKMHLVNMYVFLYVSTINEETSMETINYTNARAHLSETMDRVNEDHIPLLLTRQKGEPVVMISLSEFNALEETAYLLRSPKNAERLINSVNSLRAGKAKPRRLIEE
jgi:antitoxin YefM